MDKETKKGVIIMLSIFILLMAGLGIEAWLRYADKFVYQESLDEVVLSVDEREITLRELSYYVYVVETEIDKQARLYNPEDPLDYWNTYFNSGVKGGYISEMAKDAVLGSCVCDLIYEGMANEQGYQLTEEEKEEASREAEELFDALSEEQKQTTGLSLEIIKETEERKALVLKFASEYFENVDFTGYSGYREDLVSYAGDFYKEEILSQHSVWYNKAITKELDVGRVTTDYISRY